MAEQMEATGTVDTSAEPKQKPQKAFSSMTANELAAHQPAPEAMDKYVDALRSRLQGMTSGVAFDKTTRTLYFRGGPLSLVDAAEKVVRTNLPSLGKVKPQAGKDDYHYDATDQDAFEERLVDMSIGQVVVALASDPESGVTFVGQNGDSRSNIEGLMMFKSLSQLRLMIKK